MKLSKAKDDEIYAQYEDIDFGSGIKRVIVFYPKNKMLTKQQRETALQKLQNKELTA